MLIKEAKYLTSQVDYRKCPPPDRPEYAFIGRSNVGKSSLINALTSRKKLAHTSSSPGKTQTINHFLIDGTWYLVDLPGYGFAKVTKKVRDTFQQMAADYLQNRTNLFCTFVLIDCRHKPQAIDLEFLQWMGENSLPFALVFTKSDKLKEPQLLQNISHFSEVFMQQWEHMPEYFITSSAKKEGIEDVLGYIRQINIAWKEEQKKK